MGSRSIQQQISAGHDFDGTTPGGTPTVSHGVQKYVVATAGGLFDFALDHPTEVLQISLVLGGQTSWSISIHDDDGDDTLVFAGTTEAYFVSTAQDRFVLMPGQKLKLVTSGASTAMKCRIGVGDLSPA